MSTTTIEQPKAEALESYVNYYLDPSRGGTDSVVVGSAHDSLRGYDLQKVQIHDVRLASKEFTLETAGFQLLSGLPPVTDLDDITTKGYERAGELLKKHTGASRLIPFSHTIRKDLAEDVMTEAKSLEADARGDKVGPGMVCHLDQSYDGARTAIHMLLSPEEQARAKKSRWAILNVWQPLSPVLREPLGLTDARTVPDDDLRPIRSTGPLRKNGLSHLWDPELVKKREFSQVAYRDSHEWWYVSEMQPDEALLIKNFDTKLDGRARRCPHSAFVLPDQDEKAPARESVEIRFFVFWDDESPE